MFPFDCDPDVLFAEERLYTPLVIFLVQISGYLRSHLIGGRCIFFPNSLGPLRVSLIAKCPILTQQQVVEVLELSKPSEFL